MTMTDAAAVLGGVDWNWIVPRLSDELRSKIALEVGALVTGIKLPENATVGAVLKVKKARECNGDHSRAMGLRVWRDHANGRDLCKKGNTYKINSRAPKAPMTGKVGRFWDVIKSRTTMLTYDQIVGLSRNDVKQAQYCINYLWAREALDLV
jgi:hypothetical protein